jgi:DNA/RNA-binding domain of Phe-tRNA-synthetase-like protein
MLSVTDAWRAAHSGSAVGVLVMRGVSNPAHHPGLDQRVSDWQAELATRFGASDRAALRALPVLQAYAAHYRRFRKTYHVELQLESVLFKGRAIPRSPALVCAMVAAELRNLLLTAGHDLAAVEAPIILDTATGGERYLLLNGREEELKAGDMMMRDRQGVISSVIYGPDHRTRITPDTRDAVFAVYAPAGIGDALVRRHLEDLRDAVLLVTPDASIEALDVHLAR